MQAGGGIVSTTTLTNYNKYKTAYEEREIRYDKFQNFINNNYIKTDICYNSDLLEVMDPGFDCYICATDVIWRKTRKWGFDRGFFLASTCMENKWKIAYSASRNTKVESTEEDTKLFFHYLDDIDYISVREENLKNYITENSNIKATTVLDPVLLHEKEFYKNIIEKPKEKNYVCIYYVEERAADTLTQGIEYAKKHHLKIIEISDDTTSRINDPDIEVEFKYAIGVEEWLGYLYYADAIFTNSFHCCCFGILFERELFAGYREEDKVENILKLFGINERYINQNTDVNKLKPIDYKKVGKKLKDLRKHSSEFILNAIKEVSQKTKKKKDYETFKKNLTYPLIYNSNLKNDIISCQKKEFQVLKSNVLEYYSKNLKNKNDGNTILEKTAFTPKKNYKFLGYYLRFRIDNYSFWYLKDNSLKHTEIYNKKNDTPRKLFKVGDHVPYLPYNKIASVVAVAVWKTTTIEKIKVKAHRAIKKVERILKEKK